jgi:hypothetical protein
MVVNRLHKDLINSHIALSASRLNCQNIIFEIGTHTYFSNSDRFYILKIQAKRKCKKKTVTIVYPQTALHFALNICGISAQSHLLLFVICFSSKLNLVNTL